MSRDAVPTRIRVTLEVLFDYAQHDMPYEWDWDNILPDGVTAEVVAHTDPEHKLGCVAEQDSTGGYDT